MKASIDNNPVNPSQWYRFSPFVRKSFFATAAGLAFTFLCTFLPWTRFTSESFAGFQEFRGPWGPSTYSGLAGQVNLGACCVLFFFLFLFIQARNVANLRVFAFMVLLWMFAFSVWLTVLHFQLGIFKEIGITLTLIAVIVSLASSLTLYLLTRNLK